MPVGTRAFRGADVQQTEARREAQPGLVLMTHLSHPVHSRLLTLLICSPSHGGDTGEPPLGDWPVLKDFTCLDSKHKRLSSIRVLLPCKSLFTGPRVRLRHRR